MLTQDSPKPMAYADKVALFQTMAEISGREKEIRESEHYGKAYFWSICLPPLGVYYFFKYLFFAGGTQEDIKAGIISLILTLVSLFSSVWLLGSVFNIGTGGSAQSIQMINDLAVPANQKQLIQIMK